MEDRPMRFGVICRCCLREQPTMSSVFDRSDVVHRQLTIDRVLAASTQLQISTDDGLPCQICVPCMDRLSSAFAFKQMCKQSEKKLKNYVRNQVEEGSKCNQVDINIKVENDSSELDCKESLKCENNEKCTQTNFNDTLKQVYNCSECGKLFSSLISVSSHMKLRHTTTNLLPCKDCEEIFVNIDTFKNHMSKVHSDKQINCQICVESFPNLNSLKQHMVKHGKKKIYNCDSCDRGFNKSHNYKKHKENCRTSNHDESLEILDDTANGTSAEKVSKSVVNNLAIKEEPIDGDTEMEQENGVDDDMQTDDFTNISSCEKEDNASDVEQVKLKRRVGRPSKNETAIEYNCGICSKRFSSGLALKKHSKKHSDETMHYCQLCDKGFSTIDCYKKHVQSHKEFICNTCNKTFHKEERLIKHMWQHVEEKPHPCDECDKGFIRSEHLLRHKEALHSGKQKNPKTAFCSICNKGFTTEKYLETHMRIHTGDKTFLCNVCNKTFNTKWHLKEHSKWHLEKPFLCCECGQRFIRNDYLVTHMRRHKGEKPYKCRYCNKGFPRATDLTVHERYHTGEKTHLCTICGKGFQRQYNLTVHLRVHTGEKPYVCTYCGKKFAQGNDLKSHVRRHTGERFNCEVCGEGFIQGYHLTQHKRSIHGINCMSHIRRVEKHPQENNQTRNKHKTNTPASETEECNVTSTEVKLDVIANDKANCEDEKQMAAQTSLQPREIDLSQRIPIVPVAVFPTMHSRI